MKGAFTGANQSRAGRFELADGHNFRMRLAKCRLLQVKLLRVLQERSFEPVGGSRAVSVDVRVVAATNKNLEEEVEAGRFREDLYYRLNVVELNLPPLRRRQADIPLLCEYFNTRLQQSKGRSGTFSDAAMENSRRTHGPGNVRELENVVERLSVFCMDELVELEDLPDKLLRGRISKSANYELPEEGVDLRQMVNDLEETMLRQALEKTGWNKNKAATLLNMNRTTLVEKLKKRNMLTPEDS